MSTPFTDETDQRPAFEKLMDDRNFDEQGNFIKPDIPAEGESGRDAPPDPNAAKPASAAENTAANPPSPDAAAEQAVTTPNAESTSGEGTAVTKPAADSTTKAATEAGTAPTDEESEEAIKERLTKPGDKTGEEWRMRYYREGERLHKKLTPIQTQLDAIGSPDRAARGLEFVHVLGEPDQPIATAAEKLTEVAPSRAIELRNHYYLETLEQYPNEVATALVDETATVDELKQGLALLRSGGKPPEKQPQSAAATTAELTKPEGMSEDDWEAFKIDYPQAFEAMQRQQAAALKPAPAPIKEATPENPELIAVKTELEELKQRESSREQQQHEAEILAEGQAIESEVFEVVEDRLRELGLEPDPQDDAATVSLKKSTADEIRKQVVAEFEGPNGPGGWDDWSLCNAEQKANRKLEKTMMQLIARKDKSARDYIDNMRVRAQITLERVVTAQMKRHNAAMLQPTDKPRNVGQEHQRPEIIGGTAAAGTNGADKTPWLDPKNRLPGEDSFAAMKRMMADSQTLPGR